jgi:tellurite resistance protein
MLFDEAQARAIIQRITGAGGSKPMTTPVLSGEEARAVLRIAYLAVEADLDEDADELAVFDMLSAQICAVAGIPLVPGAPLRRVPMDDEERITRIRALRGQLPSRASRELAYAFAYLVVVSDIELAPIETTFLRELRETFGISSSRGGDLATMVAEIVTPRQREARPEA